MTFTNTQKATLNTFLANSKALAPDEQKFVVRTNIFKCYQNGHQWFNNFHSFWVKTKEEAFAMKETLEAMGVRVTLKTALGYDVK